MSSTARSSRSRVEAATRAARADAGFTLVELVFVTVLGAAVIAAAYQTLIVQEGAFRAQRTMATTQDVARTGLDVLVSELREISSDAADAPGGDVRSLGSDSIQFRAFRTAGLVCAKGSGTVGVYGVGDAIAAGDSVLVFAEGDPTTGADDGWVADSVRSVSAGATCPDIAGYDRRTLAVSTAVAAMASVRNGAAVRGFQWITYGLYTDTDGSWVLGRHGEDGDVEPLIGPLASPQAGGLRFTFYDGAGAETTDAADVVRMVVSVKGLSPAGRELGGEYADSLVTQIYLRNN